MQVESQLPYFVLKFTCPRGSLKIALLKFKLLSHIPQSGKVLACWAVCSMWHETETRTRSFYGKGGKNCPSLLLPVYHKAYHLLRNYNSSILKQEEALAIQENSLTGAHQKYGWGFDGIVDRGSGLDEFFNHLSSLQCGGRNTRGVADTWVTEYRNSTG